jgi:hypothetical protein
LTAEEIGFARTLAADQQQAVIRGIVNALAERLELRRGRPRLRSF